MNWGKLKSIHYHENPVSHIYSHAIVEPKEYDNLYENQNDLNHQVWQEFDAKYRTGFEFKSNFDNIDFNKEIICLWFFKERSDATKSYVHVRNKQLTYEPNTFLITKSKEIKLVETKKKYIRHPLIQIDMSNDQWEIILKKIR